MAFDIFNDPWDTYLQRRQQQQQQGAFQQQQDIKTPLAPEERDSLLRKALGGTMTGVQYAGEMLDKTFGGRAVRALAGGLTGGDFHPRELLSMIPGSDVSGLTDREQATTGEQVGQNVGLIDQGPGTKGEFEARDVIGPLISAGLDPATYLTGPGAAISKLGRTAEKVGALPLTAAKRIGGYTGLEEIAARMGRDVPGAVAKAAESGVDLNTLVGRPLGGAFGLRMPFGEATDASIFGTGPIGQKAAELMGTPGRWLGQTAPGRYAKAYFDPDLEGQTAAASQKALKAEAPYTKARLEDWRRSVAEGMDPVARLHQQGLLPDEYGQYVRGLVENTHQLPLVLHPDVAEGLTEGAARISALNPGRLADEQQAGLRISDYGSIFEGKNYSYARPTPIDAAAPVYRGRGSGENLSQEFYAGIAPGLQRKPFLDLPGGQTQVNELVKNPQIGTSNRLPLDYQGLPIQKGMDPAARAAAEAKLEAALQQFPLADQAERAGLKQRLAAGQALTPQETQQLQALESAYRGSRKAMMGTLRRDVVGFDPNELLSQGFPGTASYQPGLRAKVKDTPLVTHPDILSPMEDRLKVLEGAEKEAQYLGGRMNRMWADRAAGKYGSPVGEILPQLNKVRQDQAAERYLRETVFKLDPANLQRLQAESGLTNDQLTKFVRAKPADRDAMLTSLTSPHPDPLAPPGTSAAGGRIMKPEDAQALMEAAHLDRSAGPLARWLGGLRPERQPIGLYANDPYADLLARGEQGIRGQGKAGAIGRILGENATRGIPGEGVGVEGLMKQLRFDTPQSKQLVLDQLTARGAMPAGSTVADLGKATVTPDIATALQSLTARGNLPEYAQPAMKWFDWLTNLTRANLTLPFPGFHVRNATTAALNNVMRSGPGALAMAPEAANLRAGIASPALSGAAMKAGAGPLSPEEAVRWLGREAFATRAFGPGLGHMPNTAEALGSAEKALMPQIPGMIPAPTLADIYSGKSLPADWSLNPLKQEGFAGQNRTTFAPGVIGRQTSNVVEDTARGGQWLDLLNQGYNPTAAGQAVRDTHFDYSQLAPFERNVMRRVMPFYTYTRNVIPQQLGNLADYPGGLAAQAMRLTGSLRDQSGGYLPPYLAGGLAIPIGKEDDTGTQRYLSKLDLPWEHPFDMLSTGPGAVSQTGMRLLGQLNPLIKGPLELATNRQFYSGRELDDLYSGMSGVPAIDNVAYNSPFARVATSLGQLADPRKGVGAKALNLLTGAKVTDVDIEKERERGMLDLVRQYLNADPNVMRFSEYSPRKDMLGSLSQEEVGTLRLLKTLEAQARQRAAKGVR